MKTWGDGILSHSALLPKTDTHFTESISFRDGKNVLIWQGWGREGDKDTQAPRINGILVL